MTGERRQPTLAVLLLLVAVAAAALGHGGYYRRDQPAILVPMAAAAALAFLGRSRGRPRDAEASRYVGALILATCAFTLWVLVRAWTAGVPAGAAGPVALVVEMAVVWSVARRASPADRELLVLGLLAIGVVVSLTGVFGVTMHHEPLALDDQHLWRAASTITYANATAAFLAPLALLALAGLLAGPRRPALTATVVLLLVGTGATLSRAGAVSLAVGGVVLVVLAGWRQTVAAIPVIVGAGVALAGLLPSMPDSAPKHPVLAIIAIAAGLAIALALTHLPVRAQAATVVALGVFVVAASITNPGLRRASSAVHHARLSVSSSDRTLERNAALAEFRRAPLVGTGPGRAVLQWRTPAGTTFVDRYAHNEYLQVLAELGIVGIALLVLMLSAGAACVWAGDRSNIFWSGSVAALVAFFVQSAFDFVWHVPVIPLAVALMAGLAAGTGDRTREAELCPSDAGRSSLE